MLKCGYCGERAMTFCTCSKEIMCVAHISMHMMKTGNHSINMIKTQMSPADQNFLEKEIQRCISEIQARSNAVIETTKFLIEGLKTLTKGTLLVLQENLQKYYGLLALVNQEVTFGQVDEMKKTCQTQIGVIKFNGITAFYPLTEYYYEAQQIDSDLEKKKHKISEIKASILSVFKTSSVDLVAYESENLYCKICNIEVEYSNAIASNCGGFVHTECRLNSSGFAIEANTVSYRYLCPSCQCCHPLLHKPLVQCNQCQQFTVSKGDINYCLECLSQFNPESFENSFVMQLYKTISQMSNENYFSINSLCSSCNEIPDVFMMGGHWLCYNCIFSYMIYNGYIACPYGCCFLPTSTELTSQISKKNSFPKTVIGKTSCISEIPMPESLKNKGITR